MSVCQLFDRMDKYKGITSRIKVLYDSQLHRSVTCHFLEDGQYNLNIPINNVQKLKLFDKESDFQKWIIDSLDEDNCAGLADLISNPDYLRDYTPVGLEETKILDSFKSCLSALYINEVISKDENISLTKPDSLRPDILMYAAETQGMVFVELKNIPGPTRSAGTELSAYAAELRSYIPFLSDGDLFNVIISPCWPTLLRHYVFHEIFWQQKNIICLQPVKNDTGIKLEIKSIKELLEVDTVTKVSAQHITGYQLCLYDYELYTDNPDKKRLDKHIPQMKAALSVMATEGNRQNSHGFAFLWKDNLEGSLAPYSISVFNFAPFQSIERFLHNVENMDAELTEMQKRFIKIVQEQEPTGHGVSLSNITKVGSKFLEGVCEPMMEGFTTWDVLSDIMISRADLIAFQGWGMFGDVFNDRLISEYSAGNIDVSVTCPDIGLNVIEELIDPKYEFIDLSHLNMINE